jgi:hypothetical protein
MLNILQRTLREQKIPVIIMIERWNATGIPMAVHEIVHALDPRGYTLDKIGKHTENSRERSNGFTPHSSAGMWQDREPFFHSGHWFFSCNPDSGRDL